jgi:hypothetical protein
MISRQPSSIGVDGSQNWDYRYTRIQDVAFTLYGLPRIGLQQVRKPDLIGGVLP